MKHRWRTGAAGVLAALMMTTSAGAVGAAIEIDGTSLDAGEAWIENGTSYVTLAAFSRETGRSLSWDGTSAQVDGGGLDLEATPGAIYVWSNERGLYVAETVRVVNGRAVLPLRVLADASGSSLTWDGSTAALGRSRLRRTTTRRTCTGSPGSSPPRAGGSPWWDRSPWAMWCSTGPSPASFRIR